MFAVLGSVPVSARADQVMEVPVAIVSGRIDTLTAAPDGMSLSQQLTDFDPDGMTKFCTTQFPCVVVIVKFCVGSRKTAAVRRAAFDVSGPRLRTSAAQVDVDPLGVPQPTVIERSPVKAEIPPA